MAVAEFEEKQFEGPMNRQLLVDSNLIVSPGQVLEQRIGIDAAMYTENLVFWRLYGGMPMPGARASTTWWPNPRSLPPFKLNLLVQYKRPDKMIRSNSSEWASWKAQYFRFDLTPHQQLVLERCAQELGVHGVVVYCSPCFATCRELYNHTLNSALVQHSNFIEASKLAGHSRWTYRVTGIAGQAFSEPVEVASFLVQEELRVRVEAAEDSHTSVDALDAAREMVLSVQEDTSIGLDSYALFADEVAIQVADAYELDPPGRAAVHSYALVSIFCWIHGLTWFAAGSSRTTEY